MTVPLLLFSAAIDGFLLARQADGYSPSTISQYRWGLNFCAGLFGKTVDTITLEDLRHVMAEVQGGALSSVSVFHVHKAISAFFKWSSAEGLTARPDKLLTRPKFSAPEVIPFSAEESKMILKACEYTAPSQGRKKGFVMSRPSALRDKAIVLVLLDTGIRASELCRLRVCDIDLTAGFVTVVPFRSGLKSRGRVIPLGQSPRKAVWRYHASRQDLRPSDLAFISQRGGPLDKDDLFHLVSAMGERAGVVDCHPHRFRHTFAIQFLRNGGDVFTLQRLLGHSSLEMVRHYLALAQADDETAHRRASPVDNWRL